MSAMATKPHLGRSAGLVLPLFSLRSIRDAGIGEIGALAPLGRWLDRAGFRALQLLPVSTLPAGESSPYSALSAMAIDPVYITLDDVTDYRAPGGDIRLPLAAQIALRAARSAPRVDYANVRQAKQSALTLAFSYFWDVDWVRTTARAGSFAAFCSWEEWWLADYALYCALRDRHAGRPWTEWPDPLRHRQPEALDVARRELEREILFHQYTQWLADEQWAYAREQLGDVRLFGDFPFMVGIDSADVWANQQLFQFDRTTGTPPDAFSATGQDWGLPVYRWDVMRAADDRWLRQRVKRMGRLYDGYRVDHLVGFFRTYSRAIGEVAGRFEPGDEPDQIAQGERVLALFTNTPSQITAEDLGLIPDFVRKSLAAAGLPGYKVIRWERDWHMPGQPFVPPPNFAPVSVATTSTHDIDPIALWWDLAPADEKRVFAGSLGENIVPRGVDPATVSFNAGLHKLMLESAYSAGSDLLLLPMQDACGWRDRINVPATVGAENWSWRIPFTVEQLQDDETMNATARELRSLAERSGRIGNDG
jgi:4-alpha-glucanotransferase